MTSRKLAWGVLLGGTFLSSHAMAQTTSYAPEPEHWAMDARKVDRVTGQPSWIVNELQIGPAGAGGLSVIGVHGPNQSSGVSAGTNWENMLLTTSGSLVTVGTGTQSVAFNQSGSSFTPVQRNGTTLTLSGSTYTFVAADGTQITFPNLTGTYANVVARATSVRFPTGEVDTPVWVSASYCPGTQPAAKPTTVSVTSAAAASSCQTYQRLQSVSSSQGYQLHYNYNLDGRGNVLYSSSDVSNWLTVVSISSFNTANTYCDPQSASGSCSSPVATTYYSTSSSNGTTSQTVTDPVGRRTIYSYNGSQFAIQTPISGSSDIVYTLDSNRLVTSATWRGLRYGYSQSVSGTQRTIVSSDPTGNSETTVADTSISRMLSFKNGLGNTWLYNYNTSTGLLMSTQTPKGLKLGYNYDGNGNVTQTDVYQIGSGNITFSTYATYPGCASGVTCNLPTSTKDANGNQTSYSYDQTYGTLLTQTGPGVSGGSAQTRYSYSQLQAYVKNSSGQSVASGITVNKLTGTSICRSSTSSCVGGSDETRTTIAYGQTGTANNLLPTATTVAAGNGSVSATTTMGYNAAGDRTSMVGPLGSAYTTVYRYDAAHQLTGVVGPDSDGSGGKWNPAVRMSYNGDGNPSQVEQGTAPSQSDGDWGSFSSHRQVVTSYDGNGRKSQVAVTAGGTTYALTQYSYDSDGRLDCTVQRMNPNTFSSEPDACTLGQVGAYGNDRIGRNEYDGGYRITKVWTGYRANTASATVYGYDQDNKLQSTTDQASNKTTYVYDNLDRLYQIQYPNSGLGSNSSNSSDYEQFSYDNNGNLTARKIRGSSTASIISYGFDAMNRMTSKTLPSGTYNGNSTYSYDLVGNLLGSATSYPNHSTNLSFSYDALGRKVSDGSSLDGANSVTNTMNYDAAGRRTRTTWPDGFYVTYDYDNDSQLTAIHERGDMVLASYSYDDDGRRTGRNYVNGTSTGYGYDAVSRLTSLQLNGTQSTTVSLGSYNPAGQIGSRSNSNDAYAWTAGANVSRGYSPNGLNQYSSINNVNQSYDPKGNLTSAGSVSLTYGAENQIGTGANGGFFQDGLGRLEYNTVTATRFQYDGSALATEYNYNGQVLRRYVAGPGVDETAVWYEGANAGVGGDDKRFLDQDERGSVTRVTDFGGNLKFINTYDEFGVPGSSNQGTFQYTGQIWLSGINLYYYKARLYSPQLGRFMQLDPARDINGNNWYNYTMSDPVNGTDPSGMDDLGSTVPGWLLDQQRAEAEALNSQIVVNHPRLPPPYEPPNPTGTAIAGGLGGVPASSSTGTTGGGAAGNASQNNIRKISPCVQAFLASQGYGGSNLPNVTFHNGADGSLLAKAAFAHGNPAITIQNNVYVAPGQWNNFRPGTAGFFEETLHTIQWDQSGAVNFSLSYIEGSAMGLLATGDGHNSPIEAQAMGLSQDLAKVYAKSKTCGR